MRRSTLAALALGVGGAAVGGFGAAIGRDIWRSTKKGAAVIIALTIVACAVVLPFLGGRNLTRGYPGQPGGGLFSGLLLIIAGAVLALLIVAYGPDILGVTRSPTITATDYIAAGGLAAGASLLGMGWGYVQRPARYRRYAILQHNESFLDEVGLVETGEVEVTHFDADGAPLRLIERTEDSLVFMAVGKRNRRAYIGLGDEGEMVGYTGVIRLDEPRTYKFATTLSDAASIA